MPLAGLALNLTHDAGPVSAAALQLRVIHPAGVFLGIPSAVSRIEPGALRTERSNKRGNLPPDLGGGSEEESDQTADHDGSNGVPVPCLIAAFANTRMLTFRLPQPAHFTGARHPTYF